MYGCGNIFPLHEGFEKIIAGTQLHGLADILVFVETTQYNKLRFYFPVFHFPEHFYPVHLRHFQIQEYKIGLFFIDHKQGLFSVFGFSHDFTALRLPGDPGAQSHPEDRFVIYQ
jgi:hypothetical protein